jgi:hypothetical protein
MTHISNPRETGISKIGIQRLSLRLSVLKIITFKEIKELGMGGAGPSKGKGLRREDRIYKRSAEETELHKSQIFPICNLA